MIVTSSIIARHLRVQRYWPIGRNMVPFAIDPVGFMMHMNAMEPRETSPVIHFMLGTSHTYLIRDVDMIHEILVKQASHFQKGQTLEEAKGVLGEGLLTSEGSAHRRHRRLMQPSFTPRHIDAYAETMIELTERMSAHWQDHQMISITREMMALTLSIITQTMFAIDATESLESVEDNINVVIESIAPSLRSLLPRFLQNERRVNQSTDVLNHTIYDIIAKQRTSTTTSNTLLSLLMAARDENDASGLTDEELRDEVMTIYLAGHETTANLLAWTFLALDEHPEVESRFHVELDTVLGERTPTLTDLKQLPYTMALVKESLRYYPPAWIIGRTPSDRVDVCGYQFEPGEMVLMCQYTMHRDERFFAKPDAFHPARWTPDFEKSLPMHAYFPFGGGPRICIGNHFAMMEAQLLLATIGQKFKLERVSHRTVKRLAGITMRPKGDLRMRVIRRRT